MIDRFGYSAFFKLFVIAVVLVVAVFGLGGFGRPNVSVSAA